MSRIERGFDGALLKGAKVDLDANPDLGGSGPTSVTAADIMDATTVGRAVLKATDAAAARTAIGAGTGTSNLAIGTTASTAAAGNHAHAAAAVTATAVAGGAATNVQAILVELTARIATLEAK